MQPRSESPSPLRLPPAVCPGAPMKGENPYKYRPGYSISQYLFSNYDDNGYETPDDQFTIPWNAPPVRKK